MKDLNNKIDEKANSIEDEDIKMVNLLKEEVKDLEDEHEMAIARIQFIQMQLVVLEQLDLSSAKKIRDTCICINRLQESIFIS